MDINLSQAFLHGEYCDGNPNPVLGAQNPRQSRHHHHRRLDGSLLFSTAVASLAGGHNHDPHTADVVGQLDRHFRITAGIGGERAVEQAYSFKLAGILLGNLQLPVVGSAVAADA